MDEIPKILNESMKVLDESMDILKDLESSLIDEKENQVIPNLELHDLFDMTYDVHHTSKMKHAEENLLKRQPENNQ